LKPGDLEYDQEIQFMFVVPHVMELRHKFIHLEE